MPLLWRIMRIRGLGLLIALLVGISACGDPPESTRESPPDASGVAAPDGASETASRTASDAEPGEPGKPTESTPPAPEEGDFRVPDEWCGTGRLEERRPHSGDTPFILLKDGTVVRTDRSGKLGPRPPRGKDGAWSQTTTEGVWRRRALREKRDGHWAWIVEYARREQGVWRIWGAEEERARLEREGRVDPKADQKADPKADQKPDRKPDGK